MLCRLLGAICVDEGGINLSSQVGGIGGGIVGIGLGGTQTITKRYLNTLFYSTQNVRTLTMGYYPSVVIGGGTIESGGTSPTTSVSSSQQLPYTEAPTGNIASGMEWWQLLLFGGLAIVGVFIVIKAFKRGKK